MTRTEGGEAGVSRTSLRSDWPSGTSSAPSTRQFMKEGTLEGKHLERALVRHLEAGRHGSFHLWSRTCAKRSSSCHGPEQQVAGLILSV